MFAFRKISIFVDSNYSASGLSLITFFLVTYAYFFQL